MRPNALLVPLLLALALPAAAQTPPAVARPRFLLEGRALGSGTAFFVKAPGEAGAVAVAAAHSFELSELVRADEVVFQLGRSGRPVATSSGLYAEPGRPFADPGATLRDDYLLFALDGAPSGVRLLPIEKTDPKKLTGRRVRILGVPASIPQDEDDVFGTLVRTSPTRMEVRLDVVEDLRGWGGAPVILHPKGGVVGILEAAWPDSGTLRLGVAPIRGVTRALRKPLNGGLGRSFGSWRSDPRLATHRQPKPGAPAPTPGLDRTLALSARRTPTPHADDPLLGRTGAVATKLAIEIRFPEDGAVLSDPGGAFLSGRALALLGAYRKIDVMLVIDTSGSTRDPTGADINGNGIIGKERLKGILGNTDPGDSVLSAEVMAARRVLEGLDPSATRVGLVSFSGERETAPGTFIIGGGHHPAAITEQPLTTRYERVQKALDRVLRRGPGGLTYMSEGIRTAVRELKGFRGGISDVDPDSEKIVLFFTDGQPTLPYDPMMEADNIRSVLRAADQAKRAGITIHSFAIGQEALEGPIAAVEMAERTGGRFTPIRHPGDLVNVVENVSLANIESLEVRNLSTGQEATQLEINADGSFGALVPLRTGRNRIEVHARSTEGGEAREEISVGYAEDVAGVDIPRQLLAQHNRLLQRRLVELRRERIQTEREQVERTRKELQLEIERERVAARERAERQRKELDLEVERPLTQP